jgi:hypothetical protein
MEVAADFHQEEVLAWLLRDATGFERELLGVFALERKLADSLVVALENGFHPGWRRTREVSLKWRASANMDFVPAPEGFSSDGGWWTDVSGVTSALQGLGSEVRLGPTLPDGALSLGAAVEFEWAKGMSKAQFDDAKVVKSAVFPPGVTRIGDGALYHFESLESVVFAADCNDFGQAAFAGCKALKAVSLPVGCKATGDHSFAQCKSLVSALIPAGCMVISDGCFAGSTSLTGMRFPDGLRLVGTWAFSCCALKEVVLPDGCQVGEWAFYRCELLTKVAIGRSCTLIGEGAFGICGALTQVTIGDGCASVGKYAFSECRALTAVTVGDGLTSIGKHAFDGCSVLAAVTLPRSVRSIGTDGFARCASLATIAVPNGCQVHSDAFYECSPRVIRF